MTTKAYYLTHREKILQQVKDYYQLNKARIIENRKEPNKLYRLKNKDKINAWCRSYYAEKRKSEPYQTQRLFKRYGITQEEYNDLLDKQQGVCAICGNPEKIGKRLAVDHCHKTMRVRGLLCYSCNVHLGWFENKQHHIESYLQCLS